MLDTHSYIPLFYFVHQAAYEVRWEATRRYTEADWWYWGRAFQMRILGDS